MIIEGVHMMYSLCINNRDSNTFSWSREIGLYETAEEMREDFLKAKKALNEDEVIEIHVGEMLKGTLYICYTISATDYHMNEEEMDALNKEMKDEVPNQSFEHIPKRKRIIKDTDRKSNVADYVYLCNRCMCDSKTCRSFLGYTRFKKQDVESNKVMVGTNPCYKDNGEPWALMCTKCYLPLENCQCSNLPRTAVAIDLEMMDVISELNRKGYFTERCVNSYKPGDNASINFGVKYPFDIPDGWYWDMHHNINYSFSEESNMFDEEKVRVLDGLRKWVKDLPILEEAFDEYNDPIIHINIDGLCIVKQLYGTEVI